MNNSKSQAEFRKKFHHYFDKTIKQTNLPIDLELEQRVRREEPALMFEPVQDNESMPAVTFAAKAYTTIEIKEKPIVKFRREAPAGLSTCDVPEIGYFVSSAALLIFSLTINWVATCITAMVILSYKRYHTGCYHKLPEAIQGKSESQMGRFLGPGK